MVLLGPQQWQRPRHNDRCALAQGLILQKRYTSFRAALSRPSGAAMMRPAWAAGRRGTTSSKSSWSTCQGEAMRADLDALLPALRERRDETREKPHRPARDQGDGP